MSFLMSLFVIQTLDAQGKLVTIFNLKELTRFKFRCFNQQLFMLEHAGKVSIRDGFVIKIAENSQIASYL